MIQPQFSCLSFTVFVWSSLLSRGISLVVEIENLLKSLRTHLRLQSVLVTLKAWKTDVWHNLFSHKIKLSGLSLREKICFPINLRLSTPASSRHSRLSCITTQLAAALRPPMAEPPLHPPSTQQPPLPPLPLQHSVAANICKHRPCNDIWLHGSLRVGGGQYNTIARQNSSLADNNSICQYHSAQSRPPYYPDCTGWWLWPSQWTMDLPKTRTMGWSRSTYFHRRGVSAVHEYWGPQTMSKWNQ